MPRHVGDRVRPMKSRPDGASRLVLVQSRGVADAEASAHLTSSGFEVLRSIFQWAGTAKWSRWRAAERDIIQHRSLEAGRAVCLRGVGGGEGTRPHISLTPPPTQTSSVTHCANEWTMAIHQSSKPACLAARNQLQCPSRGNLIPSADSFISLTSFATHHCFLKAEELHLKGQMA